MVAIPVAKVCARCGESYDAEAFFRSQHATYAYVAGGTRSICVGCEQELRDRAKTADRWPTKIRDTIRRHARTLGLGVEVLIEDFGWRLDRMLHDAKHAYANGCPYCRVAFASMGHGPADITLDLTDPTAPPHYTTNTKWCCATCNQEKGRTAPSLWSRKLACWEKWELMKARGPRQPKLF